MGQRKAGEGSGGSGNVAPDTQPEPSPETPVASVTVVLKDGRDATFDMTGGFMGPFMTFGTELPNGWLKSTLIPIDSILEVVEYAHKDVIVKPEVELVDPSRAS